MDTARPKNDLTAAGLGGGHSVSRSLALHTLPGFAIVGVYLLLAPVGMANGLPAELVLYGTFALVGIPVSLLVMLVASRRGGTRHWLGCVAKSRPLSGRRRLLAIGFFVGFAAWIAIVAPWTEALAGSLRSLLSAYAPGWLLNPYALSGVTPSEATWVTTFFLRLGVDGIAHPIVEELYFRGYLMPRLAHLRWACPLLCAAFFALFHLWQPHNIPGIAVTVLPWMVLAWWSRSLWLSIVIHCSGNSLGAVVAAIEHFA